MTAAARTYLDHNATAPLRPAACEAMLAALELTGNASSVHAEGRRARAIVEAAREEVAALVGARPAEVIFTAGATEANNTVIAAGWATIAHTAIEHDSVLEPIRRSKAATHVIPVDADGVACLDHLPEALGAGPALITMQMANSETGVLQPVVAAVQRGRTWPARVHCDAVQAAGRVPIFFGLGLGLDYLSLSSHKIGGPQGVGALVVADGADLPPLLAGGGQERRRRAGTEPVALIAGFGAAAACARREAEDMSRLRALRDRLEAEVLRITPDAVVIGGRAQRLANTSCIARPGVAATTTLIKLDLAGIAVGAGSACSSGKLGRSHVLGAMGLVPALADGAIRVSLGWMSTSADVDTFLAAWAAHSADARAPRDTRANERTNEMMGA